MFKQKILRNEEEIESSLQRQKVKIINDLKREAKMETEMEQARKELCETRTKIKLEHLKQEQKEMQAEEANLQIKLDNMYIKEKLSLELRKLDFNNKISENTKREISKYCKNAINYKKLSMLSSIISAITSCLGLWYEAGCKKPSIVLQISFIVMICVSIVCNIVLNNIVSISEKFYEKGRLLDSILIGLMYTSITICIGYSVFTNYIFWSSINKNIISAGMYACIFDISAITLSLIAYKYDTLDFNEKYIFKIQSNSKKTKCNIQKQKCIKNVSITDKQRILDVYENVSDFSKIKARKQKPVNGKVSKDNMFKKIDTLENGTRITPKSIGMVEQHGDFYRWIKEYANVIRNDNRYIKYEVLQKEM